MEEIKALNDAVGQSIPAVLLPTMGILLPHLLKNKAAIQAIPPKTESYGPHPRQKLDVYLPKEPEDSPILAFFHGGGLFRGDKILPQVPEGLVYANLGAYFASRGLTTVTANYRRVNWEDSGEDAVFPSGGEDVSLLLKWLETFAAEGKRDVYLLGNSAGGVHVATFLFEPTFLEQRRFYASGKAAITLKGAIEQAVPFHFRRGEPDRSEILTAYYGTPQQLNQRCPYGLLEAVANSGKSREELAIPKVLVLLGEFDPEGEIKEPTKDFVAAWKKAWDDGLDFASMEGHNHISPPLFLMSNDANGERWAEDVVKWINRSDQ